MDIELYREFMTLATHKSFVAAAQALNMSQPSLSRHMATLSREVGAQLFYETRPLSLTKQGEIILKYAGKIIRDQENMLSDLRSLPSAQNRRILIVNMLHANTLFIGINEVSPKAKKMFEGLRIEFVNLDSGGLNARQMVEKDKVDISFETIITHGEGVPPDVGDDLQAIWIPEFHGELVVGLSRESPLAQHKGVTLRELSQQRFILQSNLHSEQFRKDFIAMCAEEGFYPNITMVPSSDPLEFYATDPGDGIHLLTRVDPKYKPIIADLLKQHTKIMRFTDKKRYVDAYALLRKDPERPELAFFVEELVRRAEEGRDRLIELNY